MLTRAMMYFSGLGILLLACIAAALWINVEQSTGDRSWALRTAHRVNLVGTVGLHIGKGFARFLVNGLLAGEVLPAVNNDVAVFGV